MLPMWLVPMVSSKLSLVYCRLLSLMPSNSPALLTNTDNFLSVAWNSSTNFLTDSRSARSSCTRRVNHRLRNRSRRKQSYVANTLPNHRHNMFLQPNATSCSQDWLYHQSTEGRYTENKFEGTTFPLSPSAFSKKIFLYSPVHSCPTLHSSPQIVRDLGECCELPQQVPDAEFFLCILVQNWGIYTIEKLDTALGSDDNKTQWKFSPKR